MKKVKLLIVIALLSGISFQWGKTSEEILSSYDFLEIMYNHSTDNNFTFPEFQQTYTEELGGCSASCGNKKLFGIWKLYMFLRMV